MFDVRDPRGAVLVGVSHYGNRNAVQTIRELRAHGLKRGDVVAVEESPSELNEILTRVLNGSFSREIAGLKEFQLAAQQKLSYSTTKKERQAQKARIRQIAGFISMAEYSFELYSFLLQSGAKLIGYDNRGKRQMWKSIASEKLGTIGGQIGFNSKFLLPLFLAGPSRERLWIPRLLAARPQFVISGSAHLPALKKGIPYRRAVNSSAHRFQTKPLDWMLSATRRLYNRRRAKRLRTSHRLTR